MKLAPVCPECRMLPPKKHTCCKLLWETLHPKKVEWSEILPPKF